VQVLPDGADFESSVPYHRLVAELFLGSSRLADYRGEPLSDHYRSRVRGMAAYLADVTRPDGFMPQSGDADDGRLHILGGLGTATPQDARHLLGPAATIYAEPGWAAIAGDAGAWEAAWWGLAITPPAGTTYPAVAKLYPDSGHAIVRDGSRYLLVTNSIVGTKGFGNHKHNDQLSFEYHAGGPVIVDPGSYVYTSDPAARNLFRGTAYHNTLMIDGVEQNEFNPEWLFRTFEHAKAEHVGFTTDHGLARYHGRHVGYTRLPEPVKHDRIFSFDIRHGQLTIEDVLSGTGLHDLLWHFHMAPGIDVRVDGRQVALNGDGVAIRLDLPDGLTTTVADAWYSPSYGRRTACKALNLSARAALGMGTRWTFTFIPA
jgi:hypothetical protein